MSSASAIPQVIDYLVAQCRASPLLGAATPAVMVVDGPNVTGETNASQRVLWVGYDLVAAAQDAGDGTETWPVLDAGRTEDEDGVVTCTAQYWSGGTTMKPVRDGCAVIVGAVAGLLRGVPAHSGPGDTTMGGLVFWSRLASSAWHQTQNSDGASVACVFTVAFRARLDG